MGAVYCGTLRFTHLCGSPTADQTSIEPHIEVQ